ncbi:MAG: hypothetical protein A4E68_00032 [Syntrophaceae bacterium PtaB.Bin095]|nr:MAG: hypothetical protein A4E68_00032 [Syntrophaceae bacterium PtaB.Bin095]
MSIEATTTTQAISSTVLPISTRILLERRRMRFTLVSTVERTDRLNSLLPDDLHLGLEVDAPFLAHGFAHPLDEPDDVSRRGAASPAGIRLNGVPCTTAGAAFRARFSSSKRTSWYSARMPRSGVG